MEETPHYTPPERRDPRGRAARVWRKRAAGRTARRPRGSLPRAGSSGALPPPVRGRGPPPAPPRPPGRRSLPSGSGPFAARRLV